MNIDDEKQRLRVVARETRKRIAATAGTGEGAVFHRNLFQVLGELGNWQIISGYLAIGDEINLLPALKSLRGEGRVCVLPVVAGKAQPLIFRTWTPGCQLEAGPLNTRHPTSGSGMCDPDVLLVPLLAFDKTGYRLGWGGGFYDRTLANYRKRNHKVIAIGVGYAGQEVERVPKDACDVAVDWIVTEAGVIETTANKKG